MGPITHLCAGPQPPFIKCKTDPGRPLTSHSVEQSVVDRTLDLNNWGFSRALRLGKPLAFLGLGFPFCSHLPHREDRMRHAACRVIGSVVIPCPSCSSLQVLKFFGHFRDE